MSLVTVLYPIFLTPYILGICRFKFLSKVKMFLRSKWGIGQIDRMKFRGFRNFFSPKFAKGGPFSEKIFFVIYFWVIGVKSTVLMSRFQICKNFFHRMSQTCDNTNFVPKNVKISWNAIFWHIFYNYLGFRHHSKFLKTYLDSGHQDGRFNSNKPKKSDKFFFFREGSPLWVVDTKKSFATMRRNQGNVKKYFFQFSDHIQLENITQTIFN